MRKFTMEIRWPTKGDQAFRRGNACLMSGKRCADRQKDFLFVASGFREASNILIQRLVDGPRDDSLVYPILFGYRQYLELVIKGITEYVVACEGTGEIKKEHDLQRLWDEIREPIAR